MNSEDKLFAIFWLCVATVSLGVLLVIAHQNAVYVSGGYCAQRIVGMENGYTTWSKPPACGVLPR